MKNICVISVFDRTRQLRAKTHHIVKYKQKTLHSRITKWADWIPELTAYTVPMECWNHSCRNWFWFISLHRNSPRMCSVFECSLFRWHWPEFHRNSLYPVSTCLAKECQVQSRRREHLCWGKFSAMGINEWVASCWVGMLGERNFVDIRVQKLVIQLGDSDISSVVHLVERNRTVPMTSAVMKICILEVAA
jgi:hypothetical protein